MGDLFLLSEDTTGRLSPHFPLAHGVLRVEDRRVVNGIVQGQGSINPENDCCSDADFWEEGVGAPAWRVAMRR